ncbi:Alpha-ketoglutarate-dependent dioxygenase alkB-like protein 6 [Nymphaea thermarum]|nr:Alpha-ketoglutarate-dependent dioxygenase alkB-like protein 6 [Nymphaea thermarum]
MEAIPNFGDHVVGSVPTVFYIPDFVDGAEEFELLDHINNVPVSKWKTLRNRRLQNWGGIVHEKGLLPQELPPWLTKVTGKISGGTGLFPSPINHVLINEYLPDQGIMPHQDGSAYYPVVAILSLGSPVVLNFSPHQSLIETANIPEGIGERTCDAENFSTADAVYGPMEVSCSQRKFGRHFSVIMMPRSLLIFKDNAYSDYLHGIEDSNVHQLDQAVNFLDAWKDLGQLSVSISESESAAETVTDIKQKNIYRTGTRVFYDNAYFPQPNKGKTSTNILRAPQPPSHKGKCNNSNNIYA